MTFEEKREKVKDLRPIDDVFFEVLASKKEVCQEMLRTILEDDKLIVEDVIPQSSERNIYGRSVRLDALCILGDVVCQGDGFLDTVEANRLKETEGGLSSMCAVMQNYEAIAEARGLATGRAEGRAEGRLEERVAILNNMLKSGMSFETAVKLADIPADKLDEYRRKLSIL